MVFRISRHRYHIIDIYIIIDAILSFLRMLYFINSISEFVFLQGFVLPIVIGAGLVYGSVKFLNRFLNEPTNELVNKTV